MTVVLHACCGPCASACEPVLRDLGNEVVLFFSNNNIDTREEYERRLAAARQLAEADGVELVADPYDHDDWLKQVAAGYEHEPEKGARCARCFRYSLARAAKFAASRGYEAFTTSLTVSPHKVSPMVFAAGEAAARAAAASAAAACAAELALPSSALPSSALPSSALPSQSLPSSALPPPALPPPTPPALAPHFLAINFKKKDGFLRSLRRTAELGLYRQPYCGCEFSRQA